MPAVRRRTRDARTIGHAPPMARSVRRHQLALAMRQRPVKCPDPSTCAPGARSPAHVHRSLEVARVVAADRLAHHWRLVNTGGNRFRMRGHRELGAIYENRRLRRLGITTEHVTDYERAREPTSGDAGGPPGVARSRGASSHPALGEERRRRCGAEPAPPVVAPPDDLLASQPCATGVSGLSFTPYYVPRPCQPLSPPSLKSVLHHG